MIEENRCVYCDCVGVMLYPGVCAECHDFLLDARLVGPIVTAHITEGENGKA